MPAKKFLDAKKPVCKEPGCSHDTQVRGYCRLHFLKLLKHKHDVAEGKVVAIKEAVGRHERRQGRRDRLPDEAGVVEALDEGAQQLIERVGELDLDIDEATGDELVAAQSNGRKAG